MDLFQLGDACVCWVAYSCARAKQSPFQVHSYALQTVSSFMACLLSHWFKSVCKLMACLLSCWFNNTAVLESVNSGRISQLNASLACLQQFLATCSGYIFWQEVISILMSWQWFLGPSHRRPGGRVAFDLETSRHVCCNRCVTLQTQLVVSYFTGSTRSKTCDNLAQSTKCALHYSYLSSLSMFWVISSNQILAMEKW